MDIVPHTALGQGLTPSVILMCNRGWDSLFYRREHPLTRHHIFFPVEKGYRRGAEEVKSWGWRERLEDVEPLTWAHPPQRSSQHFAVLFSTLSSIIWSRTKLIYPQIFTDQKQNSYRSDDHDKVIFLIFYKMFEKMQRGIIVYDTKFKRWLHSFIWRFAKVFSNENRRK